MRVLLALRSLQQAEGGPITAAFGLARALVMRGHEVTITAHDDGLGMESGLNATHPEDVRVMLFPLTRRLWEHSAEYARWLHSNVAHYDLVIVNSLWISHVHYAVKAAQRTGTPYIIRPHGCLTESDMAHHRGRKQLYWMLEERENCRRAILVHCTSESEADDARALGLLNVENIPLGVDEDLFALDAPQRRRTTVLFVGRIAEKKGVDILIRALATPVATQAGLRLDVLGVDHRSLQPSLMALADEMGVAARVTFHGHVDPQPRAEFLRTAGMLALPSKDENFGLAVAEAMAAALPVVITPHVSHARLVRERSAGLVVERSTKAFAAAMTELASMADADYPAMADRARAAVRESYSWHRTAELLEQAIRRRSCRTTERR